MWHLHQIGATWCSDPWGCNRRGRIVVEHLALAILEPYLQRMTVRAGNGLTKNMNQTLRSYPHLSEIVRRTVLMLVQSEMTLAWSGVSVRTMNAYRELVATHDDWGYDVPVLEKLDPLLVAERLGAVAEALEDGEDVPAPADDPTLGCILRFRRVATLPYQEFTAAVTIARRIGLLVGHGKVSLEQKLRQRLKQAIQSANPGKASEQTAP